MSDKVFVSKADYIQIFQNTALVLEQDLRHFDDLFRTDKIVLYDYQLIVEDMGYLYFHYNPKRKRLRVELFRTVLGNSDYNIGFYSEEPYIDAVSCDYCTHITYDQNISKKAWDLFSTHVHGQTLDAAAEFSRAFWAMNFYLRHLPEQERERITVTEKKEEVYEEKKKGGNRRYKSRIVLVKNIYVGKVKKLSKHEIKCLCWSVRGHYRKNVNKITGQVSLVWVSPYKKGKRRNEDVSDASVAMPHEYVVDMKGVKNKYE